MAFGISAANTETRLITLLIIIFNHIHGNKMTLFTIAASVIERWTQIRCDDGGVEFHFDITL